MSEIDRARHNLADAEAALAAGTNPYAEQNVATHRARVARLEAHHAPAPAAETPAITNSASSALPALAAVAGATPARHSPPAPKPTGTREERLRRLAKAMGADEPALAHAIASGMSPDAFALEVVEGRDPDALARRILKSDGPAASHADANVEAIAARIAKA